MKKQHLLTGFLAASALAMSGILYAQSQQFKTCVQVSAATMATHGGRICSGTGSPESALVGWVGDIYLRRDGTAGTTLWIKESGAGTNTGWGQATTGGGSAPGDGAYVTATADGILATERVLTGTANQITITDNGANSTIVLSLPQSIATASTPQFGKIGIGGAADANAVAVFNGQYYSPLQTVASSGVAKTIDWDTGNEHRVTLSDNCTFTFSHPVNGGRYVLLLTQDDDGSRTVVWPGTVLWPGGVAPTLTTAGNKTDLCTFQYIAATGQYLGACSLNY